VFSNPNPVADMDSTQVHILAANLPRMKDLPDYQSDGHLIVNSLVDGLREEPTL
jgi:hypothetical protein